MVRTSFNVRRYDTFQCVHNFYLYIRNLSLYHNVGDSASQPYQINGKISDLHMTARYSIVVESRRDGKSFPAKKIEDFSRSHLTPNCTRRANISILSASLKRETA